MAKTMTQYVEKQESSDVKHLHLQLRSCLHLFIKLIEDLTHAEEPNYQKLTKVLRACKELQTEIDTISSQQNEVEFEETSTFFSSVTFDVGYKFTKDTITAKTPYQTARFKPKQKVMN